MNYEQQIEEIEYRTNLVVTGAIEKMLFRRLLTLAKKMQEEIGKQESALDELTEEFANCYHFFEGEGFEVFNEKDGEDIPLSHLLIDYKNKNKWIPCSERLPEKIGRYLATIQFPTDFEKKYRSIDKVVFEIYPETTRWNCEGEIIAWMPLPEPYKGVL